MLGLLLLLPCLSIVSAAALTSRADVAKWQGVLFFVGIQWIVLGTKLFLTLEGSTPIRTAGAGMLILPIAIYVVLKFRQRGPTDSTPDASPIS